MRLRTIGFTLSLTLFLFSGIQAQTKKLSLKDAVQGRFSPESYTFVKAVPGSDNFSFIDKFKELKLLNASTGETSTLATLDELNLLLKKAGLEETNYFPYLYEWQNEHSVTFMIGEQQLSLNVSKSGHSIEILGQFPKETGHRHYQKSSRLLVYTQNNNVFYARDNAKANAITNDQIAGIVNGSDYTHRQEFGINSGIFIAPKGDKLAWYRKDESMVSDYPLVNTAARIAETNNIKYPMAGMISEEVTLGVYDITSGQKIFIKTEGPKDQYLTAISWDPSGDFIYIGILNREQNHLKMNKYAVETGKLVQTLFEEKHNKWVEPENPLYFFKTKPNQFIWQSERNGYNQLYLYDNTGKLIKQLSSGTEPVLEILGTDPKEENVFYRVSADLGMSRKIHKVNIKTGKITLLTPEKGTHSASLSANANYLLVNYSAFGTPNITRIINLKNNKTQTLLEAKNPLAEYNIPKAELITLTAADGKTTLNGRLIKPGNFDPSKKYPVVIYVYGGPHAQLITDTWMGGRGLWDYYMAQEGFVMLTVDNRGSANRGFEFENVIHRQLGQEEMKDQMKAVEFLNTLPYVDASRIGVHGWSYGGFMTTSLLLNYPDVFKAGVAGGPVIDWKWYEVMYGERYMDTPEENPEGYAKTALPANAKNLSSKLLMIHGAQDPVVVMQHSLEFVNACIKEGRQIDYFIYPDHEHNVLGKDRLHLMEKVTEYFKLHLK